MKQISFFHSTRVYFTIFIVLIRMIRTVPGTKEKLTILRQTFTLSSCTFSPPLLRKIFFPPKLVETRKISLMNI